MRRRTTVEYSVYDLIRILLRKWYVILITMCIVAGGAVFFSQRSFASVQQDYTEYTSQTIPAEANVGNQTAIYQCDFSMDDLSIYQARIEEEQSFIHSYLTQAGQTQDTVIPQDAIYAQAVKAYGYARADFFAVLTAQTVLDAVQTHAASQGYQEPPTLLADGTLDVSNAGPLTVSNHLTITTDDNGVVTLNVTGLQEKIGQDLIEAYFQEIEKQAEAQYGMDLSYRELSTVYTPNRSELTDDALLSQTVMQKPQQAPGLLNAACKGAAFAFLFACFGILLVTFLRDTKANGLAAAQKPQNADV